MSDETNNETSESEEPEAEQPDQAPATEPVEIPAAEPEEPSEPEVEPAAEAETAEPEAAEPEAPAEEAPAEEAPAEEAPAAEAPAAAAPVEQAPPAEPARKRSRKHVPRSARRTRTKTKREQPATRKPIVRLERPEHERGRRQERRGVVVSDAMDKTIVVKVDTVKSHRRYKKVIRRSAKFHAHDEQNQAHVGDIVRIVETRPLSKTKNWRLAEVLEAAK